MSDLKQKPRESCAQFLDRVVLAVNKQNFNVDAASKQTDVYKAVFDAAIISHFGAGLREDISKVVLGSADAPNTVTAMLDAAEAVEAEQPADLNHRHFFFIAMLTIENISYKATPNESCTANS